MYENHCQFRILNFRSKIYFQFFFFQMDYYSRPLSEKAKKLAAFKVIMVLKMYYHFLHDILLKPIMLASQNVSNSYENVNNQVDLMTKLNGGDNEAINNLDLDSLDSFFGACSIFDSD